MKEKSCSKLLDSNLLCFWTRITSSVRIEYWGISSRYNIKRFILDLVQGRDREREVDERHRPSAGVDAEEPLPVGAIASMEPRMEARKSGSSRR